MDSQSFKKSAMSTLSVANAKAGVKVMVRNKALLNAGHAIIGFATEIGELFEGMREYISGAKLFTPDMHLNAREEMGDAFYYLAVLCQVLKVKLPNTNKRVKLLGTPTDNLLRLFIISSQLLDAQKKVYYGRELDLPVVKSLLSDALEQAYGVCFQLFSEPPAVLMGENSAKLKSRYPQGFVPDCELVRDYKKEQDAAKAMRALAKSDPAAYAAKRTELQTAAAAQKAEAKAKREADKIVKAEAKALKILTEAQKKATAVLTPATPATVTPAAAVPITDGIKPKVVKPKKVKQAA